MSLHGLRVISLVHEDFEDLELWYPVLRLREAGVEVVFAGETAAETYHGKYGVPARSDIAFSDMSTARCDGLLVPGGWAPDKIRRFKDVTDFVQDMDAAGKPIGQICHAGWVLISAGILSGRTVTSTPGIRDDMENAGAIWEDIPAVRDRNLVSSRRPPDLPEYMKLFLSVLTEYASGKESPK